MQKMHSFLSYDHFVNDGLCLTINLGVFLALTGRPNPTGIVRSTYFCVTNKSGLEVPAVPLVKFR